MSLTQYQDETGWTKEWVVEILMKYPTEWNLRFAKVVSEESPQRLRDYFLLLEEEWGYSLPKSRRYHKNLLKRVQKDIFLDI